MSRRRTPGTGLTRTLEDWLHRCDGHVSIDQCPKGWQVTLGSPTTPHRRAIEEHLTVAIESALSAANVNPCATCGWEQTCEDGCHT